MLLVLFNAGDCRYAVLGEYVKEIIPQVHIYPLQSKEPYILGTINLAGTPIVVVDGCQLIHRKAASFALHTRILLLEIGTRCFGLLAEQVTMTIEVSDDAFKETDFEKMPFLKELCYIDDETIQLVDVSKLMEFLKL